MTIFLAEHLDLTLEDVGGCVELVYTPVRDDGVKGSPKSIVSGPISPGEFKIHLVVCLIGLNMTSKKCLMTIFVTQICCCWY